MSVWNSVSREIGPFIDLCGSTGRASSRNVEKELEVRDKEELEVADQSDCESTTRSKRVWIVRHVCETGC